MFLIYTVPHCTIRFCFERCYWNRNLSFGYRPKEGEIETVFVSLLLEVKHGRIINKKSPAWGEHFILDY